MPIFEYECKGCGERFEFLTLGSEKPVCKKCGGTELEKMISSFAVSAVSSGSGAPSGFAGGCGTCGDPRGPGACQM